MSLPGSGQGALAVETVTEDSSNEPPEMGTDAALTARAIVAVTFGGAGFWYFLWKLALLVVAGR